MGGISGFDYLRQSIVIHRPSLQAFYFHQRYEGMTRTVLVSAMGSRAKDDPLAPEL